MSPLELDGVDHAVDVPSLHTVLRLALGAEPAEVVSWSRVHALAERGRLIGVAWRASAATIRRRAPSDVTTKWQRQAVQWGRHAERQLDLLVSVTRTLSEAGVECTVLKGAPLAQQVYGDFTVRPSLDLDVYVPLLQRASASRVLTTLGWHSTTGVAPEEETFERTEDRVVYRLEVHSSLLDDPLLHHVRINIESRSVLVGGYELPAHGGRLMPAYLATHLAKHNEKPLLWLVDFFLLWSSLSANEQSAAVTAAREAGLARHLEWAVALTAGVAVTELDATQSQPSLELIARELTPAMDSKRLLRLVRFSQSPAAALQVLAGRIWPAPSRTGFRRAPTYFARRAVRWIYRRLVFERPSTLSRSEGGASIIELSLVDSERRLVESLRSGAAWVIPADGSMEPAVPAFGAVRVVPLGRRTIRCGDVVVKRENGRCTLRRVVSLGEDSVLVTGDAHVGASDIVARSEIVGLCDLVDVGDKRVPIESRPYGIPGLLRAIVRARLHNLLPLRSG